MGTRTPINGAGPAGSTTEKTGSDTAGAGAGSAGFAGRSAGAPESPPLVAGVEHLGMVDGSSTERLIADVEAAAASAPIADPVTGQPSAGELVQADGAGEWRTLTPHLVTVTCGVVLPRWAIPTTDQAEVAESLGLCLEQLFPGGVDGKYACWVRLVFACGAITVSTAQRHGGKLPPLFAVSPPAEPAPPPVDPMHVTSLTQ
jgi:hypothetical protein